jgi:hypothetical protein
MNEKNSLLQFNYCTEKNLNNLLHNIIVTDFNHSLDICFVMLIIFIINQNNYILIDENTGNVCYSSEDFFTPGRA